MLENLASWCHRHRWTVVIVWVVAAVGAVVAAGGAGGDYATSARLVGTDSDAAYQLLAREFPSGAGETATIVFHRTAAGGVATARPAIDAYLHEISPLPRVAEVASPFDQPGRVSADGTIGYATVDFTERGAVPLADAAVRIQSAAAGLRAQGVETEFGSYLFQKGGVPSSEGFGLLAAVVILLIAFGSVVAMGLPLVTAVVGILIGLAGVSLWANVLDTPDFTVQVASMVGIGVGIDYALFIVTRYREALTRAATPHDAMIEAIGTAGRAVAFAGCTVVISLLGMFLMGLPFLYGLAIGTATSVLVAVAAALTLLPALLSFVGRHLDRLSVHRRAHSGRPSHAGRSLHSGGQAVESGWHRWSRFVQRRAKAFAVGGLALLLALGVPVLSLRLASADLGNDPAGSTTREAYDLLATGFGPGSNGPLVVTLETPDPASRATATAIATELAAAPGVASVGPVVESASGRAALIQVIPTTSPQSPATARLVHRLRSDVLAGTGLVTHIGGATASDVDFSSKMSARLPVFIGAVLVLSFLLLMAVFRSVLVPLKAVLMNLLSIGAAYGVMVAVFQWGWLASWFGLSGGAPIEPWAPMILFAIVFGLSMDYEVFLLSSVKERYDATGDNPAAVVDGLASTARVITAAAAIMVCVFGSFIVGDLRSIKLVGLGLSAAVLIDATIVRMVLVPATMQLLGRRNWWMPRSLDRVLPRLHVEAHPVPRRSRPAQAPAPEATAGVR